MKELYYLSDCDSIGHKIPLHIASVVNEFVITPATASETMHAWVRKKGRTLTEKESTTAMLRGQGKI